ncbi:hypothetical protein ig2599ANME_0066 [groundwater metagenome]
MKSSIRLSAKSVVSILLDVFEKEKADFVVLSSHGRTGFNKLKLGYRYYF